jgi:hypothetical protein
MIGLHYYNKNKKRIEFKLQHSTLVKICNAIKGLQLIEKTRWIYFHIDRYNDVCRYNDILLYYFLV